MSHQTLYIDVQFDGNHRHLRLLTKLPIVKRYEHIIRLPPTCANDVDYQVSLYIDGMTMSEQAAKELVVELLASPIWRTKRLGKIQPLAHDAFWNIVILIDTIQEPQYAVLNARYHTGDLQIHMHRADYPAFLQLPRHTYPLEVAKTIYETLGFVFTERVANDPKVSRAHVGMQRTVCLDAQVIAESIVTYLQTNRYR